MFDTRSLHGHSQFLHQYVHNGVLKACSQVLLMMLHEVRVFFHPFSQIIEKGSFQAREGVVHPRDVRLSKFVSKRVALACEPVDDRTTGIAESHHLGTFVDSLSGRIVDGLSQHLHVVVSVDLHDLRVAT